MNEADDDDDEEGTGSARDDADTEEDGVCGRSRLSKSETSSSSGAEAAKHKKKWANERIYTNKAKKCQQQNAS